MYVQFEPPQDLKHLICFFYVMEHHTDDEPLQPLLPSATEVNGWQYSGRWRLHLKDKHRTIDYLLPEFYMVGQQTISYRLTAEQGLAGIFGAALQPGTNFLLTAKPAYLFTNNPIDTTTLFEPGIISPFIRSFKNSKNNDERLDTLTRFYRQFDLKEKYDIHREALQIIYQHKGCITVEEICTKLHVNERYLQRAFRQKVGIPPSAYLQMLRFNNVFTELSLSEEKQNIESLAMLFNYYDISHFNKTHKVYFGVAPSKLMRERLVLLQQLIRNGPYLLHVQKK